MASPLLNSENLTGLEIVPYVAIPEPRNNEALHQEREEPPVVISLMKVPNSKQESKSQTPEDRQRVSDKVSFKLPKRCFTDMFKMNEQPPVQEKDTPHQTVQGSTRNVFWSRPINFRLPEDSDDRILNMDEEAQVTSGMPLSERLEGWKVERRQRDNTGRYDKYFYHKKIPGKLRSFIEVEAFIIHGRLPQKPQPPKDQKRKEAPLAFEQCESESSENASVKRPKTPLSSNDSTEEKEMVEKIVKEAWNNFSNSGNQNNIVPPPTDEHKAMVEEFLSVAYNNLQNSFSTKEEEAKTTLADDSDEETHQMISEIMDKEREHPEMLFNKEPEAPREDELELREQGSEIQGDSTTRPSQNGAPVNEGPTVDELFLSHFADFEDYLADEEKGAPVS